MTLPQIAFLIVGGILIIAGYILSFFATRFIFGKLISSVPDWLKGGIKGLRVLCFFFLFLLYWVALTLIFKLLHPNTGIVAILLAFPVTAPFFVVFSFIDKFFPNKENLAMILGILATGFFYFMLGTFIELFKRDENE